VSDPVTLALPHARRLAGGDWQAEVIHVDRFGSLVSSVARADLDAILAAVDGDPTALVVQVEDAVLPLVNTYAEVAEGEPCALRGSAGRLEVAVNRGSAARLIGAGVGTPVRVRRV
jgi:hypothetical protein